MLKLMQNESFAAVFCPMAKGQYTFCMQGRARKSMDQLDSVVEYGFLTYGNNLRINAVIA